jgi:replicative DNA helicase
MRLPVNAVLHAERALLGAILFDPDGQRELLRLTTPDDFHRPWHGQVLAAMRRVDACGESPGPLEVYAELKTDPDLPRSVSHDAVLLADLLHDTPRSAHAPAYAGIVIGSAIRRRLTLAGGRLCQFAQATADPVDDRALETTRWVIAQESRALRNCWQRWTTLPTAVRQDLPASQRTEPAATTADRPPDATATTTGQAALRDIIATPNVMNDIAGWLHPRHFADPGHATLYQVITDLHQAGIPIDTVTVSWHATRHGISIEPRELDGGCGAFAPASTTQVYRRAILADIQRTGHGLQASAADPRQPVTAVLRQAGKQLVAAQHDLALQQCRAPHREAEVLDLPGRRATPGRTADAETEWEAAQ